MSSEIDNALAAIGDPASSEPRSRLSRLVELAKAGGKPVAMAVAAKLGVDLVREVVVEATRRSQELHAEEFFRLIAEHLRTDEMLELAIEVADGIEQPHVYTAVAEGFENMRRCHEEPVKRCIAVLVAQELHDHTMPTSYFRTCSAVLASAPLAVLEVVRDMLESWLEIWKPEDLEPKLCRGSHGQGGHWFAQTKTRDLSYVKPIRPDMNEWFRFSEIYATTGEFHRGLAAVRDAGFGWETEGSMQEIAPTGHLIAFRCFDWDPDRFDWARNFSRCLAPLPVSHPRKIRFVDEPGT